MKQIIWLVVGLLLGVAGTWMYITTVREPALVAETTKTVKEMIEAERIAESTVNEIEGTVVSNDTETNTFVVKAEVDGVSKDITVTTDDATMFYRLVVESNEGRERIGASLITAGASVLIITNDPISGNSTYAAEIILL